MCHMCRKTSYRRIPIHSKIKSTFQGEHSVPKKFHAIGEWKSWPWASACMISEPTPYFSSYNAPHYPYQNTNYPQSW